MPLDPRAKRLLDMLALSGAVGGTSAERRESFRKLMVMADRPGPMVACEDLRSEGGIEMRHYRPDGGRAALVFFHGGGLVAGSIDTHDGICRRLAAHGGFSVISVGYRLAPEWPFPAARDDALAALAWVRSHAGGMGIDDTRLAIGGDSAGALLALLVAAEAPALRAQLLLCPVVDLERRSGSRADFAKGFLIDDTTIARDVSDCFGSHIRPPAPLRSLDLRNLPAAVIVAAEFDPFRDEAGDLAGALTKAGVSVNFKCYDGMPHSFYGLPAFLPQAEPALAAAATRLAELLT